VRAKIPATVITGFLGAGKTTMIRNMLANTDGRRIALIINEFGDLGVDGALLRGCAIEGCREGDMIELSNGCICCTVADDFVPAMEKLLNRTDPPEHIVIETSGLALPQPLVRAFGWPELRNRVTVDGVVTLVDGKALAEGRFAQDEAAAAAGRADHETPLSELFDDQLACADMIVLNKADLLEPGEADSLARRLAAEARPGVRVLKAEQGRLPLDVLLGLNASAEEDMAGRAAPHHDAEGEDHDHDEFESFVADLPGETDRDALLARIAAVIPAHDILRLKGFAAIRGKPLRLAIQAVGARIEASFDAPFDGPRATRLVVIGEAGLNRGAILSALSG
jgi:cobalamin biosynthesis protein CobW